MKRKYIEIVRLAEPYYKKGRAADRLHHLVVAKMMQNLLKEKKGLDEEVMMAVALLHDIGYSKIPKDERKKHWSKSVMKNHMLLGAELATKILKKLDFSQPKIEKVYEIIATHDNPTLGLSLSTKEAEVIKEADILWMTTEEAFWLDVGRRMIEPEEWLEVLEKRFTKEKEYTDYLKTKFAKRRTKTFLKLMRKKVSKV
jgi:putative nucleotidyltransferase with HDIG domain